MAASAAAPQKRELPWAPLVLAVIAAEAPFDAGIVAVDGDERPAVPGERAYRIALALLGNASAAASDVPAAAFEYLAIAAELVALLDSRVSLLIGATAEDAARIP